MPRMRTRVLISFVWGLATGLFCYLLMSRLHQGAGDFQWALRLSEKYLAGQNPYDSPLEQYPFPAAIFAFPFIHLRLEIAAAAFYGLSSALLAFGLMRNGYHRLLIFLAYPYWAGLLAVQWSTVIMASALLPTLLPVTMAKPQVGLPVLLTRLSRRGLLACVVAGLLSLILLPNWPHLWLSQTKYYQHFYAILVSPGPLVLLALLRYRDRDSWLLVLTAAMPQRWFFDSFILWLIPRSRREILVTVFFSWCAGIWRWYHIPHTFTQVGRWTVVCFYLPMLAVLLLRTPQDNPRDTEAPTQTDSGACDGGSRVSTAG
jgi:hypothetical protein